jgi:hypothetical protein
MSGQDKSPQPARLPLRLGRPSRWAAFILGLAGLGSGSAAVFITRLEAGPVALIAAGLLLVMVGLVGHAPTRLKIGDNEAEFASVVGSALETAALAARPDAQAEVSRAVEKVAELAPEVAAGAQSILAWQITIWSMLREVVPGMQGFVSDDPPAGPWLEFSGFRSRIFELGTGGRTVVLALMASGLSATESWSSIGLMNNTGAPPDPFSCLVIAREDKWHALSRMVAGMYYVVVPGREDALVLEGAIRAAVTGPPLMRDEDFDRAGDPPADAAALELPGS